MSNYDDSCRTTVDCSNKADCHILVDPRVTNAGKEADIWMNVRPGTDGALGLAWANVAINEDLVDWAYIKKWTNGPFLVVPDMKPSHSPLGTWGLAMTGIETRLLKESDMIEGGKDTRFMVWDDLNDRLTYFDAARADGFAYEGEHWTPQTKGKTSSQKGLLAGVAPGWVADLTGFDVEDGFDTPMDPALYGEYEVTLKDGTVHKAIPVWDLLHQRINEYSPEAVEKITNISADRIREAARIYATRIDPASGYGNGGIQYMLANEHYGTAVEQCRVLDMLAGITGNYDTPAGMRGTT
ncbi:MAG: molybdopterin-dependent oxidoreductase, partial [Coriobacteriales bacterium]|nr:molybdopterin-dependent oxidoreductase [Coriobacteriales bacterium]